MTPQREEAERFMRLARRDEAAFRALLNSATVDCTIYLQGKKTHIT